jgi:co-chaperonin GroES (HSP10)
MKLIKKRILIEPILENKKQKGLIHIPDSINEKKGRVISIGNKVKDIKVNDIVFYKNESNIQYNGNNLIVVKYKNILAINEQ